MRDPSPPLLLPPLRLNANSVQVLARQVQFLRRAQIRDLIPNQVAEDAVAAPEEQRGCDIAGVDDLDVRWVWDA